MFQTREAAAILQPYYKAPEKTLEEWVKQGLLLRLKRGHYGIAEQFDPLLAAGALHGPSYISFETALQYYGLIPERVEQILSVVDGRPLRLATDFGEFIYHSQERALFGAGMTAIEIRGVVCLIATREKALLDLLASRNLRAKELASETVFSFVVESFRIEPEDLWDLSLSHLQKLGSLYRNFAPRRLVEALVQRKKSS